MPESNYVFFGTPRFAAIILEKLAEDGWIPRVVICNPDRPVGRRQVIAPPLTKLLALQHNISVFQPEVLEDLKSQISNLKSDFFIVAAYAKIIPKEILAIPRLGAVGVHPSLLPKFRGPSPIQSAILDGISETGVTLFLMDEKVDHGSIIRKQELGIRKEDNYETLETRLAELAGDLLVETLPKFVKGEITPLPQDEVEATYTKKFTTEDAYINPEELQSAISGENKEKVLEIERKIRALNPEPGTWTLRQAQGRPKRIKILEVLIKENKLVLKTIQPEGKKPVNLVSE